VECKGSEGRRPHGEIPSLQHVYELVVFKGSDKKNIQIVAPAPAPPTPVKQPVISSTPVASNVVVVAPERTVFDPTSTQDQKIFVVVLRNLPPSSDDTFVKQLFGQQLAMKIRQVHFFPPLSADVIFMDATSAEKAVALFTHDVVTCELMRPTKPQHRHKPPTFEEDVTPAAAGGEGRSGFFDPPTLTKTHFSANGQPRLSAQDLRKKNNDRDVETFGAAMANANTTSSRGTRGGGGGNNKSRSFQPRAPKPTTS
jgi:hypothetical protein